MAQFKKFFLKPGQRVPKGSTGKALPDGGILFYGDDIPQDIESVPLSVKELQDYKIEQLNQDLSIYRASSRKYPMEKILDFILVKLCLKDRIKKAMNNEITISLKEQEEIKTTLGILDSFVEWYYDLKLYVANVTEQINSATTIEEVDNITWDFSQFDNTDPELT